MVIQWCCGKVALLVEYLQDCLATYEGILQLIALLQIGHIFHREAFLLIKDVFLIARDLVVALVWFLKFPFFEPLLCIHLIRLAVWFSASKLVSRTKWYR